jgi:cytochrome P450
MNETSSDLITSPATTRDLYSDELLLDPYPVYEELRSQGPVVWMEAHGAYVLPRFEQCRDALRNWRVFTSSQGVMMNDPINQMLGGQVMLCLDGEAHTKLRTIVGAPLTPKALVDVQAEIDLEAIGLVERLVATGTFDAAGELAQYLPVNVVSRLIGLPESGRDRLLDWARAAFNTIGPFNQRTLESLPLIEEMNGFITSACTRDEMVPGGWGAQLWDAQDRGDLAENDAQMQLNNYLGPALDTTVNSIGSMIWLFSQHPEQWTLLRDRPDLIGNAINECMRMESAIQGFARHTTKDDTIGGSTLPAGSRVLVLYGSANRDDRQFADPTRFDIERANARDHLAFGYGSHVCAGANLARTEMRALLEALLPRVRKFELVESSRRLNNVTRGFATCMVNALPA